MLSLPLREKSPYSEFFRPVFPDMSLRIQSECGKLRTRKCPNTDTFYAAYLNEINKAEISSFFQKWLVTVERSKSR